MKTLFSSRWKGDLCHHSYNIASCVIYTQVQHVTPLQQWQLLFRPFQTCDQVYAYRFPNDEANNKEIPERFTFRQNYA